MAEQRYYDGQKGACGCGPASGSELFPCAGKPPSGAENWYYRASLYFTSFKFRARSIINQAIQDHSIGQYASLESDRWGKISSMIYRREQDLFKQARESDPTLPGTINTNELRTPDSNKQDVSRNQIQSNADHGGIHLMPGGDLGNADSDSNNTAACGGFGDCRQGSGNTNFAAENEKKNNSAGEDGLLKNRCERRCQLKKGCNRQRPCQRCKDSGLSADECLPQLGLQPSIRSPWKNNTLSGN